MLLILQKMIYRCDITANPEVLYIFGDNLEREGKGGQAAEMRGETNSFGFATKRSPKHGKAEYYFWDSDADARDIIDKEFENLLLRIKAKKYKAVVIPMDGIGTGLSCLPEYAPKLLQYINDKLEKLEEI